MATAKNIDLIIINNLDCEVKVTKFEYLDEGDWETENWLGIDGNQKIFAHRGVGLNRRNLRGVGDELTRARLTYRERLDDNNWGSERQVLTDDFYAYDDYTIWVFIEP